MSINSLIAATLNEDGLFAISDLEGKTELSRSSLNNTLQVLVRRGILNSSGAGAAVKYRLADNELAVRFLFLEKDYLSIVQLARAWGVGIQSAKIKIKPYVENGLVLKQGLPPKKIYYRLAPSVNDYGFSEEQKETIDKYYAYVTPDGQLLKGISGFLYWAENKSGRKDFRALAKEYLETRKKMYSGKQKVFLIDATEKLKQVFGEDAILERLFHRDFDSLPVFGKTYLSQMIRIAKAGRTNNAVMNYIAGNIRESIERIVHDYHIDAIGFIPPTVMRKAQLMDFLAKRLSMGLQIIEIKKNTGLVPVQQKSLKRVEDRMLNANKTIIVSRGDNYDNVLLVDDVTGSGSTMNETAKKLLREKIAKKVYGFTVTGSAKAFDFEIISEA